MSCSILRTVSSSEAVASNDDVLTEIMVHLPIKSLMKLKCVSKHWQSLISSPCFSHRLYPDSHLVSGLILHRTDGHHINKEYDFVPLKYTSTTAPLGSLTFVNHPSGLSILQSCNGLLLCSGSISKRNSPSDYCIYNPTSHEFVTVPPPLGDEYFRFTWRIGLAYDPAKSSHFKIVCIRSDSSEVIQNAGISYQIEVYSSETGSWRLSGVPFVLPYNFQYSAGVFWNGAIHWIDHRHACLYFKVDEEQLGEMPMPPAQDPADWVEGFMRSFLYFGESREHLHFVVNVDHHSKKFDVYEMQRDYSGCFVKYSVDLDAIIAAFPEMDVRSDDFLFLQLLGCYKYSILGIIREANDEESYIVLHIPGKVIHYNLNDKTFTKICDFHPGHEDVEGSQLEFKRAYHYTETLARFG